MERGDGRVHTGKTQPRPAKPGSFLSNSCSVASSPTLRGNSYCWTMPAARLVLKYHEKRQFLTSTFSKPYSRALSELALVLLHIGKHTTSRHPKKISLCYVTLSSAAGIQCHTLEFTGALCHAAAAGGRAVTSPSPAGWHQTLLYCRSQPSGWISLTQKCWKCPKH